MEDRARWVLETLGAPDADVELLARLRRAHPGVRPVDLAGALRIDEADRHRLVNAEAGDGA